jgi:hypothetical protein
MRDIRKFCPPIDWEMKSCESLCLFNEANYKSIES